MWPLSNCPDEELEAELHRRKVQQELYAKPKQMQVPNFKPLIEMCQNYIDQIANHTADDDTEHYIFETAINCIFGSDAWAWINSKLNEK